MPVTIQNYTGDGVHDTLIRVSIERPDTAGGALTIGGQIQVPGVTPNSSSVNVTGSLTAPAPGAETIFWIIQADALTGAMTVKQSTVAIPAVDLSSDALTPQVLLFADTTPVGDKDTALDVASTPDSTLPPQ